MTVTSKRETILNYIRATTLALIGGTGNYNLSLVTITRDIREPQAFDANDLPAVMIRADDRTEYSAMTAGEYVTGTIDSVEDGMPVVLIGVVRIPEQPGSDVQGIVDKEMNKLHSDMLIAMFTDTTLGGNCENVAIQAAQNSLDWLEDGGLGVVFQRYGINYRFEPGASTPTT